MSKPKAASSKKLLQPAHKWQNWLATFLIAGVLLTALSLLAHRDGRSLYCVPAQTHALAELGIQHQQERGLPFTYYRDDLPDNCWAADVSSRSTTPQAAIAWRAVLDVLVWGIVAVVIVRAYHLGHRSAHSSGKKGKKKSE